MIIRSKAPLRISFGGGGTDVSPYAEECGGVTLSATIDKYAYCTITTLGHDLITVKSLDYDILTSFRPKENFTFDGNLDLIKAAFKVLQVDEGLDMLIHSDMPPGSGLGASSTMTVALVGALRHYKKLPLELYDIAELAYKIEREEMGISGGRQDQYAASFGDFNFTEFYGDRVVVNPLRIREETRNELEYRLILCYTGKTRLSAGIIQDQVGRYVRREIDTVRALDETKKLAIEMKTALLLNNIDEFGLLLNEAWQAKKKFTPKISDTGIDDLYSKAIQSGALGGKLLGAGGGGYLLLLCEYDKRHLVADCLEDAGGKVVNFAFENKGLHTWETSIDVNAGYSDRRIKTAVRS